MTICSKCTLISSQFLEILLITVFYPFNGHIKTAEQQTIIQQYGD